MFDKEANQNDIVQLAEKILSATGYRSSDDFETLSYLIADMMMFCYKKEISFKEVLGRAQFHFDCEK